MAKVKYLVKMSAPCDCCNSISYGFNGLFDDEEQARQWIVNIKLSKDYKPTILPISISSSMGNDKILFRCEKPVNFSIN